MSRQNPTPEELTGFGRGVLLGLVWGALMGILAYALLKPCVCP